MASTINNGRDLTTGEAARLLRCSINSVIRACKKGVLQSYKLPCSRHRRVVRESVREHMQQNGIPGWEQLEASEEGR